MSVETPIARLLVMRNFDKILIQKKKKVELCECINRDNPGLLCLANDGYAQQASYLCQHFNHFIVDEIGIEGGLIIWDGPTTQ